MKEEGRRKKEEGRRKKEEGRSHPPLPPPRGEIQEEGRRKKLGDGSAVSLQYYFG